jgi:hypothetical protein
LVAQIQNKPEFRIFNRVTNLKIQRCQMQFVIFSAKKINKHVIELFLLHLFFISFLQFLNQRRTQRKLR